MSVALPQLLTTVSNNYCTNVATVNCSKYLERSCTKGLNLQTHQNLIHFEVNDCFRIGFISQCLTSMRKTSKVTYFRGNQSLVQNASTFSNGN